MMLATTFRRTARATSSVLCLTIGRKVVQVDHHGLLGKKLGVSLGHSSSTTFGGRCNTIASRASMAVISMTIGTEVDLHGLLGQKLGPSLGHSSVTSFGGTCRRARAIISPIPERREMQKLVALGRFPPKLEPVCLTGNSLNFSTFESSQNVFGEKLAKSATIGLILLEDSSASIASVKIEGSPEFHFRPVFMWKEGKEMRTMAFEDYIRVNPEFLKQKVILHCDGCVPRFEYEGIAAISIISVEQKKQVGIIMCKIPHMKKTANNPTSAELGALTLSAIVRAMFDEKPEIFSDSKSGMAYLTNKFRNTTADLVSLAMADKFWAYLGRDEARAVLRFIPSDDNIADSYCNVTKKALIAFAISKRKLAEWLPGWKSVRPFYDPAKDVPDEEKEGYEERKRKSELKAKKSKCERDPVS